MAKGTELAAAYVTIIPSLKGAQKTIQRQLSGIDTASAGRRVGQNFSTQMAKGMRVQAIGAKLQGVGRQITSVGQGLTNSITKPAAGAAVAVGGIATALGFKRLVGIDTARAKLKALGHDSKSIKKIMDSALESVKGTSYGLGDAATIAASAVAAGVKPGKDLTKYLKMTADAAAIAGTELSDMGYVINQVQTAEVAYTDSLNMLSDRGIDIYGELARQIGVTKGEVRKLASEGKISSEMFFKAIDENVGGAAKIMGESSFVGAWSNVKAAMGRVGAAFLDGEGDGKGFFSQMKPLMADLTESLDNLRPKAEELGVKFGEAFMKMIEKLKEAKSWWDGLDESTQSTILKFAGLAVILGPVMKIVGSIGSSLGGMMMMIGSLGGAGGIAGLAGKFALVGGVVALVAAAVWALWNNSEDFRESMEALGGKLSAVFTKAKDDLQPIIDKLRNEAGPALEETGTAIADMVTAATPLLEQLATGIGKIVENLGHIATVAVQVVGPAFQNMGDVVTQVLNYIYEQIEIAKSFWSGLGSFISAIASGDWSGAWQSIKQVASSALQGVQNVISTAMGIIGQLLVGPMKIAAAAMGENWDAMVELARAKFEAMKKVIGEKIDQIIGVVRTLPGRIVGAIPGPGRILYAAGSSIMGGLKSGLEAGWEKVEGFLGWVTDRIPFKKGPPAKDKKLLEPAGKLIMKGFLNGLKSGYKNVEKSLVDFTKKIKDLGNVQAAKLAKAQNKRSGLSISYVTDLLTTTSAAYDRKSAAKKRRDDANREKITLKDIALAHDRVTAALDKQKKKLADLVKARASMKSQIANSIRGELDLAAGIGQDSTNATGHTVKGKTTFKSVAATVKNLAAKAKTFALKLKALVKKGIPAGLVQEVAGLGTEEGIKVANALLSGSKAQVKELAADYKSLNSWSSKAGGYVAGQMYDAGIQAQKGLIKGLEKDAAKLDKAATKLANRLVKAVKKALGIHSPSRVFRDDVGVQISRGVVAGLDQEQRELDARVSRLVGVPSVSAGSSGVSGRSLSDEDVVALADVLAGRPFNVSVDASLSVDKRQAAQFYVDAENAARQLGARV